MTSETYVLGGSLVEKIAVGERVRRFASTLGPGHVEALVENHGDRFIVPLANACPFTSSEYEVAGKLEGYLNEGLS